MQQEELDEKVLITGPILTMDPGDSDDNVDDTYVDDKEVSDTEDEYDNQTTRSRKSRKSN